MTIKLRILITLFTFSQCIPLLADFVHPGIAHSKESLIFVRQKIKAAEEPWKTAWKKLNETRYASLDWKPDPHAHVERGSYNNPNIGSSDFSHDAMAAYVHAICWAMTDDQDHARKATQILDAWSYKLKSVTNHDAKLLVGMAGYHYCIAAEIMRHTWNGWPKDKQQKFSSMLRDVCYPVIKGFYPSANGNWDASILQTTMAIGIFLDDKAMCLEAKNYFLRGEGNGALGMYFKESGQCQESGRDQGHTQMGLEYLANTCETAWIQGLDLYKTLDNRLLKGFEYTAKYNLGEDVPYEPYKSFEDRYHYKKISDKARGKLRPMYQRVFNHYHNRKGLPAPFSEKAALKLRTDKRWKAESCLDTLMYADQPADFKKTKLNKQSSVKTIAVDTKKMKVVCFGDSITKRGYHKLLGEKLAVNTVMAGVAGNSTAQALRRMQRDVLDHDPDIVVIFFGTNDLRIDADKVHVNLKDYQTNLETMIHKSRKIGAKVVLCTLPPINIETYFTRHDKQLYQKAGGLPKMIAAYRDVAIKVAKKHTVPLVDLNKELEKEPQWMSPDGVHPSKEGTRIIARLITAKVQPLTLVQE